MYTKMNIKEAKNKLRREVINKLKQQNITERNIKSNTITHKILSSRFFLDAQVIMLYAAMKYEVDTTLIIENALQNNKKVILPLLDRTQREITPCEIKDYEKDTTLCDYGFREPKNEDACIMPVADIELVIVPGICFDLSNHRLGRGAGYYDKFLSRLHSKAKSIGLAFDFQIVKSIPHEAHDVTVDAVVSNL